MKKNTTMDLPMNPWPIMMTMSMMNTTMNLTTKNLTLSTMNMTMTIMIMMKWNKSTNKEKLKGKKSNTMPLMNKMMTLTMILSETAFFSSMFYMFLSNKIMPNPQMNMSWKFSMNKTISTLNTMILLTSSMTATSSIKSMKENKMKKMNKKMNMTKMTSYMFTTIQMYEMLNTKFNINNSSYWSTFIMLTSFHTMHVIIGSMNFKMNNSKNKSMINMEKMIMSCWYWHMVDSVWIMIFTTMY